VEEWAWALGGGVVAGCDRRQRRRKKMSVGDDGRAARCASRRTQSRCCVAG
jgi:hypothetical protein